MLLDEATSERAGKILFEAGSLLRGEKEERLEVALADEQEFLRRLKEDLEKGHTSGSRERRAVAADSKIAERVRHCLFFF